jgi:transcriptional regulator with XRE-family HTH domain
MTTKRTRRKGVKGPQEAAMDPARLRRIRETLKLTQEQFAEELGVRPLTIGLWETGKTPISKSRALAIIGLAAKLTGRMNFESATVA